MHGVKLIEKTSRQELMALLGVEETLGRLANGVQWYRHGWGRDNNNVLKRVLDFEVLRIRGRGRSKIS